MAAPFTLRKIGVPPNSANLTEARRRVFDFFRAACRSLPTVMDIYNLQDVVAPSQLRFAISAQIRNNAHVTDPKAFPLISLSLCLLCIGWWVEIFSELKGGSFTQLLSAKAVPPCGSFFLLHSDHMDDKVSCGFGCWVEICSERKGGSFTPLLNVKAVLPRGSFCAFRMQCIVFPDDSLLLLQVIDLLLFKGMEELTDIVDHAKQRHHIIGQYVVGEGLVQNTGSKDRGKSDFLKNFYTSNYF
ncbi:hypothetical protein F2Q70_00023567 [Brassica cretica]|uniref:NADH dehydrogenase [ubiquinone] 1 alpha subcomplex subunit 6 n=1 Tax=Brassica cretica TaxID=69181 RepID=A0A8S9GSG1_BRACR|nr:hypothetical protein F2Q70_00023567 [Brassica cretica]